MEGRNTEETKHKITPCNSNWDSTTTRTKGSQLGKKHIES